VAEIIFYNRLLSTAERQAVESYLSAKYAPVKAVSVSPAAVSFSDVDVINKPGSSTTQNITITNTGNVPLNFQTQTGQAAQGLVLAGNSTITVQSVTPATTSPLAVGASVTVVLKYQPTAEGNNSATLSIYTDATTPKVDVTLAGNAVPVEISHISAE
jgi:hypothetical protein